jgi:hypothetical protein
MNLVRIALATLGAFVAYMMLGGLMFALVPSLKVEFLKYPAVYRSQEGQMSHLLIGMGAMLVGMLALAGIYAIAYRGASGLAEGARFGALIGLFAIGAFVVHNYVNLNIGLKLTLQQAAAYFLEWLVTGMVIGLIYRPAAPH